MLIGRVPILLRLVILIALLASATSADWTLQFTERDDMGGYTNYYKNYGSLLILVDDMTVENYSTLAGDYSYGNKVIDLTPYINGSNHTVSFELLGKTEGLLLYNIDILHDNRPVRFTPWNITTSDRRVRGFNYSDTRLVMILGGDLSSSGVNVAKFTTQSLIDAPELVIKQSDLTFSKPIYKINDGDLVEVSITVHNLGAIKENNAHVELYLDDVLTSTSSPLHIESEKAITVPFVFKVDFGGKKFKKIEARVIPSNALLEGKDDNNQAIKYLLKRPSMFFSDIQQTPIKKNWGEEPYSKWFSKLESEAKSCLNTDYSTPNLRESIKSDCLVRMALYYQITQDEAYAEKTIEGLTHIGDGSWTWLNRSKSGSATKGSSNKGINENYGLKDVSGASWGKILLQNAIAYDWIHDYAVAYDDEHGTNSTLIIRDRIAHLVTDSYLLLKEVYSYGDPGTGASAFAFGDYGTGRLALEGPFGVAALSILDYDGLYQDVDGSPYEWVTFVEKDLAVQSQTGAKLSNLDQHFSRDGLYEEGSGYRDYFEPGIAFFIGLYNNVLGVNMAKRYTLVDGSMKDVPLTMSSNYLYPNICVSYASVWEDVPLSLLVYEPGTPERGLINFYIKNAILPSRGYRREAARFGTFYNMLLYNKDEPSQPPNEPSYFSPNGSMNILRGGWDRNSIYSFLKAPNEPTLSGHAPSERHQLSFDIWSKGAYPIVDAGNERFLKFSGSAIYGHSSWLFYENGLERWIERGRKGQYGDTCNNPAYIVSSFTSAPLDFVEGNMNVSVWYFYPNAGRVRNPFMVTRSMIMVSDEYLIVSDYLASTNNNSYSMLIPFGSANGHTGEPGNPNDNWALGELWFDGVKRPWFDYTSYQAINSFSFNISEVVWETLTEINKLESIMLPVNMTVFLNPPSNIVVNLSGMHYGNYGQENEWAIPYLRVNQEGNQVRYLTVFYPNNVSEKRPSMAHVPVSRGDDNTYATSISGGGIVDLVLAGDGELLSAGDVVSNARLSFRRVVSGNLNYFFIVDGSGFKYNDNTLFYSSRPVMALVVYGSRNVSVKVQSEGPAILYLRTGFDPSKSLDAVTFGNLSLEYLYDGKVLKVGIPGSGDLVVKGSDSSGFFTSVAMPEIAAINGRTTSTLPRGVSGVVVDNKTGKIMRYKPSSNNIILVGAILALIIIIVASAKLFKRG